MTQSLKILYKSPKGIQNWINTYFLKYRLTEEW